MNDRGSVLLEYVVLCCGVGTALILFMHANFYNPVDGFVGLGRDLVVFYQRFQTLLARPVP